MRHRRVQIGLVVSLLLCALSAQAQWELITLEGVSARHLAGFVTDSTGAPVSGVAIEDCDPSYKQVLASATTDANGHFDFPKTKMGTTHYLHLESRGFDPMRIPVKLRRFSKANLKIQLYPAS
jgi:uncharacterized protein YfaS (alpha-2-macroglobulin family)